MDTEHQEAFKPAMSTDDFREWGKNMVDYICDYLDNIGDRNVIPDVEPGYLRPMMPQEAPEEPENWPDILKDVDNMIMPGITHWQHPRFHAYFPAGNSFPSIMGDMLSDALGTIGFSWAASPAMAELEIVVLDWLARMLQLPEKFTHEGTGGGALQGSASDAILCSMLAARYQAIERHNEYFSQAGNPNPETAVLSRLVAYCSNLAHSSVEKAGMISFVQMRQMDIDDQFSMIPEALEAQILEDLRQGFIPFYVCATLGTTACCSFDNVSKIGPIARKYDLWFHIDGAYGVSSCICPEFRHYLNGVELADSINFNPNKFLLTNFDASVLWVADKNVLTRSMVVNPVYLQHKFSSKAIDFRHWGIPLSRRFRALKLWFVIRKYGAKGLRAYIRSHVRLAKLFASLLETDPRFEIVGQVELGLVCFRLKGSNTLTQCLIRTINESRELHVVPAMVNDLYIIRFAVCRESASDEDIHYAWNIIKLFAEQIIAAEASLRQWREHTRENSIRKKRRAQAAASALELGDADQVSGSPHETEKLAEISKLEKVLEEDKENESETEDAIDDEDDEHLSTGSSDLGDLDNIEIDDSDIIELAKERLTDLKELGAKEAYNVLAQQLKNLGATEVKTYEECELSQEDDSQMPTMKNEESAASPKEPIKSPEVKEKLATSPVTPPMKPVLEIKDADSEFLSKEEEQLAQASRVGRFKSVGFAVALKGMDKLMQENNRRISDLIPESGGFKTRNYSETTADTSFLNGTLDPNLDHKLVHDAVSSTPFVHPTDSPRHSINGRRFSCFTPSMNPNVNASMGPSSGTPVVARLVSMVMNASGNASMNTSQLRQPRRSLKPSAFDDLKEMSHSLDSKNSSASPDISTSGRSRKLLNTHNNIWRVGMNQEDDIDDVFVCDSDLCVGSFSKENTLTRLRRQTLLKMISDPISYKNNRRNFRSLRENRRMTTLLHDYEPRERPKSEYIRRPTVQVCENIHRAMENGDNYDEDILRDLKRRNKSMFESSSNSFTLEANNNNSSGTSVSNKESNKHIDPLKRTISTPSQDDKIVEEDEDETK